MATLTEKELNGISLQVASAVEDIRGLVALAKDVDDVEEAEFLRRDIEIRYGRLITIREVLRSLGYWIQLDIDAIEDARFSVEDSFSIYRL